MRVSLDATPLLGRRTGVGTYVAGLLEGLTGSGLDISLTPFTLRGRGRPDGLPPGVAWASRPVPARALQAAWQRGSVPPVEWLAGRCDVFHGTNFVLPPRRRARGVVTVHDLTFLRHPEWVQPAVLRYRDLVPRAVRTASSVLTPTHAVAEEIVAEYGVDPARVRVTPLGVSPGWSQARPADPGWLGSRGLPSEYLLFTGAREPRKNLAALVEAHRRAGSDVPPLVLAGPEGWGAATETGDGVHVTGYLTSDALRGLVAGATAVVMPSWYEGFGLPVLEALAAGTPVVASAIPAHEEVAGGHARLFPPGDVGALEQVLRDVSTGVRHPAASTAGREHAASYTWARCAEVTAAAYRDAVA